MNLLQRALRSVFPARAPMLEPVRGFYSQNLDRAVDFDVYLPPNYYGRRKYRYPLLICNDGQDLPHMQFTAVLESLYRRRRIPYVIVVGIHANQDRLREYGTARQADYRGRGDKAAQHRDFVVEELLTFLYRRYRLSGKVEETAIAGFSLGGLSALDIAWSFPELFGTAGVFSGALWWRSAPVDPADPDAHRIMHDIIRSAAAPHPDQRFWFQCGTADEQEDRNNNGIIDAIDDTLDLLTALRTLGQPDETLRYLEIPGGEHAPHTWGQAMPDFLVRAFSDKK